MKSEEQIWHLLDQIPDPEIPAISIVELGVVRSFSVNESAIEVVITPTYTGCPATNVFEQDITQKLQENGFELVTISHQFNPPWTTDWIDDKARKKLEDFGIAPPDGKSSDKRFLLGEEPIVKCPQCKSINTKLISQFGSTACKSLYQCNDCLETFDYFKCI